MKKSLAQLVFGILVVLVGLGFLLDSLNVANFGSIVAVWWPVVIILIGLVSLLSNPRVILWPIIIVAVGLALQLRELGWITFSIWSLLWPLAIIFFGFSILFKGNFTQKKQSYNAAVVDLFAGFSGHEAKNNSDDFKGGKTTAIFGGIGLDLREAKIKKDAKLDVFTAFGGLDLQVPDNWNVEVTGLPLFGGWDDKTRKPKDKNAPTLHITGTCIFGGVDIKN